MNITECEEVEWAEPSLGVGAMTCLCEFCHETFGFHKGMELPEHLGSCMFRMSGRPAGRPPAYLHEISVI
jgi:hypothetical protein